MSLNHILCLLSTGLLLLCATSCADVADKSKPSNEALKEEPYSITISVAASTVDVIGELVREFETAENARVTINSGASSTLANQIVAGAPVDLFVSASQPWAEEVSKHGLVSQISPLVGNRLVLIVPTLNRARIESPKDLLHSSVGKISLAGQNVPAGIYAQQALTRLKLFNTLKSEQKIVFGQDVRTALAYVERGEADAGIVYATDIHSVPGIKVVHEFDPSLHDPIIYTIVLTKDGSNKKKASALFDFFLSDRASTVWTKYGFEHLPKN